MALQLNDFANSLDSRTITNLLFLARKFSNNEVPNLQISSMRPGTAFNLLFVLNFMDNEMTSVNVFSN